MNYTTEHKIIPDMRNMCIITCNMCSTSFVMHVIYYNCHGELNHKGMDSMRYCPYCGRKT